MKMLKLALLPLLLSCLVCFPPAVPAKPPSANLEFARKLNQAFIELAETVSPSVVVITVVQRPLTSTNDDEEDSSDFVPPDFWRYFHRQYDALPPENSQSEGSGIIIREDGYILTNGHVVEDADTIQVRLKDGRTFKATLRGTDPQSDIAVIKIDARGLPAATLADSSKTRVGEFAVAIGAPFNLDYSVTFGHVSAKGRSNVILGYAGIMMDQDYIQTDALINPGNSGGPLVNINGEVIGVNTLIRGLHSGIGFAIPSNLAREVSDQLIARGKFTRAWLGVEIRSLRDDPDTRASIKGLDDGVVVQRILPNGPAAQSELQRDDIITAVDGKPVSTAQDLRSEIRGKTPGQPVTLTVYRPQSADRGQKLKLKVLPGEWVQPAPALASARRSPATRSDLTGLGLTIHALTRDLASRLGADASTNGVLVVAVEKGTPAARKGLKPGDIITSINRQPVTTPRQFREAVQKADLKKGVALDIVTGKTSRSEVLKEAEP